MSIQAEINRISGAVETQTGLIAQIMAELEGKTGGSAPSAPRVDMVTAKNPSNAVSITFTGLKGTPKTFSVVADGQLTLSTTRYVGAVHSSGSGIYGIYLRSNTMYYSESYYSFTYSNGTLTVNSSSSNNGGYFASAINYRLIYTY